MLQMKPSNLLMACLLSAKASVLFITPAHAAASTIAAEPVVRSAIELEVVNLKTNATNNADSEVLTAQNGQDYDQTQDRDQTQDQDQDQRA
jgi:hypothetical protein